MSSSTIKNPNEFQTFTLKSTNNAYEIIGEHSFPSSSYPHVRDSGYETASSNLDQQRFPPPSSPSNVSLSPDGQLITVTYFSSPISSHLDSSLSSSNTLSRTLRTFSQMPTKNMSGNQSSTLMNARLAEQEIIEV
jgi:hypothetical protein